MRHCDELAEDRNQLRDLASQVISAQEDERRRVSRELHDDTAQVLFAQLLQVSALKASADRTCRRSQRNWNNPPRPRSKAFADWRWSCGRLRLMTSDWPRRSLSFASVFVTPLVARRCWRSVACVAA